MIEANAYQTTLKRLLAVHFKQRGDRGASHAALLREFLRRMALVCTAAKPDELWPIGNVASQLDPVAAQEVDNEPSRHLLYDHLRKLRLSPPMIGSMMSALYWARLTENPSFGALTALDPYEPLIWMYERGGSFWTDPGGTYEVSDWHAVMRGDIHRYYRAEPLVELDAGILDQIDEEHRRERSEQEIAEAVRRSKEIIETIRKSRAE